MSESYKGELARKSQEDPLDYMYATRYFEVRKEVLSGKTRQYNVCIDGTPAGTSESEGDEKEIVLGFVVWEFDENGVEEDTIYYPVKTDTETFKNNEEEVLAEIINDHPAERWQNHEW